MNFFKLHKPLVYKYRPIYYDPKKEAAKERQKQMAEGTEDENSGTYRPFIRRGTFREMADKRDTSRKSDIRKSNVRLVVIIGILILIAYFLMK